MAILQLLRQVECFELRFGDPWGAAPRVLDLQIDTAIVTGLMATNPGVYGCAIGPMFANSASMTYLTS